VATRRAQLTEKAVPRKEVKANAEAAATAANGFPAAARRAAAAAANNNTLAPRCGGAARICLADRRAHVWPAR